MAHKILIKKDGVWKQLKDAWVKKNSEPKKIKKGWVKENGKWHLFYSTGLPKGAIIPYFGTEDSLPSSWLEYTAPYDHLLMGSDSLNPVGSTGGDWYFNYTGTLPFSGTHTGTAGEYEANFKSDGDCQQCSYYDTEEGYAAGGHSHTSYATDINAKPLNTQFRLIQAQYDGLMIPINGGTFSVIDLSSSNLTRVTAGENTYFSAGSSVGLTDGSDVFIKSFTTNTTGTHHHGGTKKTVYDEGHPGYFCGSAGSHYHNANLEADIGQRYAYIKMALWKAVASEIDIAPGNIVMWEGITAPDGWAVCDGSNGTPDLRNKFVIISESETGGESGGDNILELKTYTTTTAYHYHPDSYTDDGYLSGSYFMKHSSNEGHNHNSGVVYKEHIPKFFALTFIMKLT